MLKKTLVDVILADNTRPACCHHHLIRYSAGGVVLALSQKGFDARYVDLISDRQGPAPYDSGKNLADVCCYAVFFGNKLNAFRHMQEVRRSQKVPRLIIAFGAFASAFPEEILSRGLADVVVTRDPEFVIPAILQKDDGVHSLGTIPNLFYTDGKKVIHTREHSFHDLDQIPFIGPYFYSQGHRPAFIQTARGCKHHCVFCDRNAFWGGGVRYRSIENVLQEIKELVEIQHVRHIEFLDEDLLADHKHLASICEGMRRIKGEFAWKCSACVDSANQKMLLLMRHCYCREINFGVESASIRVLRRLGKMYGRQDIFNAVRWAKEAGLKVEAMITIGNPGEEQQDRDLTLSALSQLGTDLTIRTNHLMILPGTAFYHEGLRKGWFTRESFFEDEGVVFYDEKR